MYKVSYNSGDGIVEVIIRDEGGDKIEHFKMNWKDQSRQAQTIIKLQAKYGLFERVNVTLDKEGFFDF